MKKRSLMFIGLYFLLTISYVSAGVFLSSLDDRYNLGDMIVLETTVDPIVEGRLLNTVLLCDSNKVIEFNNFPENGVVTIKMPLNIHTINQIEGKCTFYASYNGENRVSEEFEISKRLVVSINSDSFFSNPGEEIVVAGSANRQNGFPINGEVQISIPEMISSSFTTPVTEVAEPTEENSSETPDSSETSETEIPVATQPTSFSSYYGKITNGQFSIPITLEEKTPAGNFRLEVLAYEMLGNERASEGVTIASLQVFQILSAIDLALNYPSLEPGETLEVRANLLDQTGTSIDSEVSVVIREEKTQMRIYEKIFASKEVFSYIVPTNLTAGYYEVEARSGEFSAKKRVFINEKAIASFLLQNQTLTITNIGNIPYKRDVEIMLNDKPFVKRIDLALGESTRFKLTGSNSAYNIKISDGNSELLQDGVVLTGYAVSVNEAKSGSGLSVLKSPIIWIFLVVILLLGVLFLFRNIFKKRSYAYHDIKAKAKEPKTEVKTIQTLKDEAKEKSGMNFSPMNPAPSEAESVLLQKGHRSKSTVVALKIRNTLNAQSKQNIEKVIEHAYQKRGAVYEEGNFIFVILSDLMTKNVKNEIEAAKLAEKISMAIRDHNVKFKEIIDYGIGINSGEILAKVENKKLKFTPLGNIVIGAKKLADQANKTILISKESYEKGSAEIKAEKKEDGKVYEIKSVVDQEKNKKFIEEFLRRSNTR